MKESTRKLDSAQEEVINSFVKKYLFDKISTNVELIYDKSLQIKGIDLIADRVRYDLKAQSSPKYINNPTDTFIVEISFLNKADERIDGWFIKEDLLTDNYAFIYIDKAKVSESGYIASINDIDKIEVILVNKHNLSNRFFKQIDDITKSHYDIVCDIENKLFDIEDESPQGKKVSTYINGIKFVLSAQLYERPICAVLTKDFILQSAIAHYEVTKENFKNL